MPNLVVVKVIKANENGVSDLLLCVHGQFMAIELKVGNNKPTDKQEEFLINVFKAGGIIGTAWTWGEVKATLLKGGYDFDKEEEKLQEPKS